jgi:prepilin-type N-terminal cleavage/methylation domain-containing protein
MQWKKGFTLVELLIAVGVMAILAGLGAASYTEQLKRGRDQQRMADLGIIQNALEQYRADYGHYPGTDQYYCDASIGNLTAPTYTNTDCGDEYQGTAGIEWAANSDLKDLVNKNYLDELPIDPINDSKHYYGFEQTCSSDDDEVCGISGITCPSNYCCAYELNVVLEDGTTYEVCGK